MINKCIDCDKWKLKKQELLDSCQSIFDAHSDLVSFEDNCIKTCPYNEEIVDK